MSGILSFGLATFILLIIGQLYSFSDSFNFIKIYWAVYFFATAFISCIISKNSTHSTISEYANYIIVGVMIGAFSCAVNSIFVVIIGEMGLDWITIFAYLAGGGTGGGLSSLISYAKKGSLFRRSVL